MFDLERPTNSPDQLVQWLLAGIEWKTTVFHVGQYCGRWRASTEGHGLASFHAVLRGMCYLHRPGQTSLLLEPGDAVFLLRDEPHHLSPDPDPRAPVSRQPMLATQPTLESGTSLTCGFFQFTGPLSHWLVGALAQPLLLKRSENDGDLRHAAQVFELMRDEADRSACGFSDQPGDAPSPLLERLSGLLFHYVLRHAIRSDRHLAAHAGCWSLARHHALAPLLGRLMVSIGEPWSVERMADAVHMSRARFFRLFTETCGEPPAQFLLRLRMQMAAQRLHHGDSLSRVAEHVGFQSPAAFSRAFTRVFGEPPGQYQRQRRYGAGSLSAH